MGKDVGSDFILYFNSWVWKPLWGSRFLTSGRENSSMAHPASLKHVITGISLGLATNSDPTWLCGNPRIYFPLNLWKWPMFWFWNALPSPCIHCMLSSQWAALFLGGSVNSRKWSLDGGSRLLVAGPVSVLPSYHRVEYLSHHSSVGEPNCELKQCFFPP